MRIGATELPHPVAFVFPGGGALCAYQVGVMHALIDHGIVPDQLIGVSAGGLNAALFAWNLGADGWTRVDAIWRRIRRRDLLRIHPLHVALAVTGRRPSFIDNRHGRQFLHATFGERRIEDAPMPLAIVVTDLATGQARALSDGSVATAVLASTAFPGAYPPVERDGHVYVDGGVVADIPLDIAVELGARSVVVLQLPALHRDGTVPRRAIDILLRASTYGVEAHGRSVLTRPSADLAVVEIPAPPSTVTTFAIGNAGEVIDHGYETATHWLAHTTGDTPRP